MEYSSWILPALCLHAVALGWVAVLSALLLPRYPVPFFRAWVFSQGWRFLSSVCGIALTLGYFPKILGVELTLLGMLLGSMFLLEASLLFRQRPPVARARILVPIFVLLLGTALWGAGGLSIEGALFPGFVALLIAQGSVAWAFWPRAPEQEGFGGRLVSFIAAFWTLEALFYPWCLAYFTGLVSLLQALSALLTVTAGMGMLLFLLETSLFREQQLGGELSLRNQDLLKTLKELEESRSETALYTTVARERGALVRQVVHDLRNANQAMQLITESIADIALHEPRIQVLAAALERQLTFVSNFLREKLLWMGGEERSESAGTSLQAMFDSLEQTFRPIYLAKNQQLEILKPEPDAALQVSSIELDQIVGNLLRNAHQHTPPGALVRLLSACSDGWATISVADNGPGVPHSVQASLGRALPRTDGSGLGLVNVNELVTRAGGAFGVSSELGTGSEFYVRLPLVNWGVVKGDD